MRKRWKRNYVCIGAITMAVILAMQTVSGMASLVAADRVLEVRSDSQTQMSSEPEVVYVNHLNDTTVRSQSFDSNWKFYLGDAGSAHTPAFDDSSWRQLSLPHDYSIEQEFSKTMEAESGYLPGGTGWYRKAFTVSKDIADKELRIDFGGVYMNSTVWINGQQVGTHPYGYTPFSFNITDYIKFGEENVIAVKVDHKTPSSRWYSGSGIYRSVNLTITDKVYVGLYGTKITTPNLPAEKNRVDMNINTTVVNAGNEAVDFTLAHTVFKKGGEEAAAIGTVVTEAQSVDAGGEREVASALQANAPELWSVQTPTLYTVRTKVTAGGKVVDTYDTDFGFRHFNFDSNTGFSLNGENMKLKGVCMHHDQGALGSIANRRAIERQVEILKEMGCNSIRVTHNPAADELIEIANEKGMLVIDEAFDGWSLAKNGNSQDYAKWFNAGIEAGNQIIGGQEGMKWSQFDLNAMIKRGNNAPSLIMWSLGNEVIEGISGSVTDFPDMNRQLIEWAKEIDDTRPVTIGDNKLKDNPAAQGVPKQLCEDVTNSGGTVGLNYCGGNTYDALHQRYPDWKLYGAETASSINSRGIYDRITGGGQTSDKQLTSYDNSRVGWGALASDAWYQVIKRDFVAGEYVWTGFDYIGEPTPWNGTGSGSAGSWPAPKNSYFGIVDTAGFPKDSYYFYQSQWNEDVNTLHILPAWNENVVYKDGNNVPVVVYSDARSVELFFTPADGGARRTLGKKTFTEETTGAGYKYQIYRGAGAQSAEHANLYLKWNVPYADGTIEAVATDAAGNQVTETMGRSSVTTTGGAAKLAASADRTEIRGDGKDLSYITVDITDSSGNIVPDAANRVEFEVEGEGVLVGVDNGSAPDHDSYKGSSKKAFSGKVLAIVQSKKNAGTIRVTAKADGLTQSVVELQTKAEGGSAEKQIDRFYMVKNYYVKAGNMPQLPATVEARFTDGSVKNLPVVWEEIPVDQIQEAGTFVINGRTEGNEGVSVTINMIDDIGGILNYAATTPVGVKPVLPTSRPAVMPDGTILSTAFSVDWEEPADSVYDTEGIVTISGTANVFGRSITVSASIRVQSESVTIGDSVSGNVMNLTQNIPPDKQSDTLDAIKDGSTVRANVSGGANPSLWSNYDYSQEGNTTAEITFEYATQQRLGQIVVHFAKDAWAARYPDAETTEIFVSESGTEGSWTKLETRETIGQESGSVTPYTYEFAPVGATFIKFRLTNKDETITATPPRKPCIAVTEIELKLAQGSFVTNTTANLAKLIVNDAEVPQFSLNEGSYQTPALFAEVTAVGADNAATTVLSHYQKEIKILIQSEDNKTMNTFVINLETEAPERPDSDGEDYPVDQIVPTAGSEQPETGGEGPARFALDGDPTTLWHTRWSAPAGTPDQFWIQFELDEVTLLDGLRYLPRAQYSNGSVREYEVRYSTGSVVNAAEWPVIATNWPLTATGEWTSDAQWKLAKFERPVEAKFIRLIGKTTFGDQINTFMSGAEIRVRKAVVKTDIADTKNHITAQVSPNPIELPFVDAAHPAQPKVTVMQGGAKLRYGIDYKLQYENNAAFGEAAAIVTGIDKFTGEIRLPFTIVKKEKALEGIFIHAKPAKTIYNVGEKFDPVGLEIRLFFDDETEEVLPYAGAQDKFAFSPTLDTALGESHKQVTVTYEGKNAVVDITVIPPGANPDTEPDIDSDIDPDNSESVRKSLQKYYDECKNYYKEANHSRENWNLYMTVMKEVEDVLKNKDSSKADMEKALKALMNITEKMNQELKGGEGQKPPEKPSAVKTGDDIAPALAVFLLLFSLGIMTVIIIKKRKA